MYPKSLEVEFRLVPAQLLPEITAAVQHPRSLSVSADTIILGYLDHKDVLKLIATICTDSLIGANPEFSPKLLQNAVDNEIEGAICQYKLSETSSLFYRKKFDGVTNAWECVDIKAFMEKRAQQRWEQMSQNLMTVDEMRTLLTQP